MRELNIPRGPYNITPIFAESAIGAIIKDISGKEYIDFAGGIGVQNTGHNPPEVLNAVQEQMDHFIHSCFHVAMYEPYVLLAKRLNEITPGDGAKKTFFVNSGAEAVENTIKIARYATKRPGVIAFQNAFHGRTYMGMSLTSQVKPYKWGFGPMCSDIYRIPYAYCYRCAYNLSYPDCQVYCADYLVAFFDTLVADDSVAAVIAEPVQGEGGFIVPPPEFFPKIKLICEKHGILLIVDEIQTGMGRTGKLFASEHFEVAPDLITTGKSLAAGFPLAGVTGRAEVMDAPHAGGLGSTYGGNPVSCKAALAVLDLLNDEMLVRAAELGEKVKSAFLSWKDQYEIIGDVRGLGPMVAMELVKNRETKEPAKDETKEIVKQCHEKGLIVLSCGVHSNVIRTLIPFVISDEQLEKGLGILNKNLKKITESM